MSKQDPYRFNLKFDETDENHRKVCDFLNDCGRKKARYIVKAVLAYWGKEGCELSEAERDHFLISSKKRAGEISIAEEQEEDRHLVEVEADGYSAEQAEIELMKRNYQMFESLGKES